MTPDLAAVVINLRATRRLTLTQHMGRALQHASLSLFDPALSDLLHQDSDDPKPLTISDVMRARAAVPLRGMVAAGDPAWIRITGLDAAVTAGLLAFAADPRPEIVIDNIPWAVTSVLTTDDQHPWAGQDSYANLLRSYTNQFRMIGDFTLEFALPTAFKTPGEDGTALFVPLPIPQQIFRSLRNRWNAFAPMALPDTLFDFAAQHIAVARFDDLRTQPVMLKTLFRGFTGTVTFNVVLPKHPSTDHIALAYGALMLAHFAFYSGVGIKTTTGMGMLRLVDTRR